MADKKRDDSMPDKREFLVSFLLRSGIALVFLYAAISAYLAPEAWIGFIPPFIKSIIPAKVFLGIYGLLQIALSLWLLSNKETFYAASISALIILVIVLFNIQALEIVFRDIAILLAAIALAVFTYRRK